MKGEDLRPQGAGWRLRLHEKGGKHHTMSSHHALAEALHAYITATGITFLEQAIRDAKVGAKESGSEFLDRIGLVAEAIAELAIAAARVARLMVLAHDR